MRARLAILPVLLVAVVALLPTTQALASSHHVSNVLAQSGNDGKDKSSEGGAAEPVAEETGPLWTYQMSRSRSRSGRSSSSWAQASGTTGSS